MTMKVPVAGADTRPLRPRGHEFGDLRGEFGGAIPQSVLDEHRNVGGKSPEVRAMERIWVIDGEMKQAAARGNTAKLRTLKAEKRRLESEQARRSAELLERAQAARPALEAPKRNEQRDLNERRRQTESRIGSLQAEPKNCSRACPARRRANRLSAQSSESTPTWGRRAEYSKR
jgi:hypothetical protein